MESGHHAPACTDNFQVAAFVFDGREWLSCEQCYQVPVHTVSLRNRQPHNPLQACKSLDPVYSEAIRGIQKQPEQSDSAHGMCCWSEGQRHKMILREDWDAVKIEIMYRCERLPRAWNIGLLRPLPLAIPPHISITHFPEPTLPNTAPIPRFSMICCRLAAPSSMEL